MDRFFCFVFLLLPLSGKSQLAECSDGQYCRVTAPSGLNLREQPAVSARKVTAVPYGSIVLACGVPCENCEWDSIDGRSARWMRVFYGDYSGYAFGGFLDTLDRQPRFSLLHHWFNVIAPQIWLDTGLEYTGLFARSNGRFDLKKLQLKDTLINRYGTSYEPERVRKMVDTVGLVAFFANLPAVKPGRAVVGQQFDPEALSKGWSLVCRLGNSTYILSTVGAPSADKTQLLGYGLHIKEIKNGQTTERTYLDLTLRQQPWGDYEGGIYPYWAGDLDGDGRLDLILSWSRRSGGERVVLLLSSAAGPGHFFKEVCFYSFDDC